MRKEDEKGEQDETDKPEPNINKKAKKKKEKHKRKENHHAKNKKKSSISHAQNSDQVQGEDEEGEQDETDKAEPIMNKKAKKKKEKQREEKEDSDDSDFGNEAPSKPKMKKRKHQIKTKMEDDEDDEPIVKQKPKHHSGKKSDSENEQVDEEDSGLSKKHHQPIIDVTDSDDTANKHSPRKQYGYNDLKLDDMDNDDQSKQERDHQSRNSDSDDSNNDLDSVNSEWHDDIQMLKNMKKSNPKISQIGDELMAENHALELKESIADPANGVKDYGEREQKRTFHYVDDPRTGQYGNADKESDIGSKVNQGSDYNQDINVQVVKSFPQRRDDISNEGHESADNNPYLKHTFMVPTSSARSMPMMNDEENIAKQGDLHPENTYEPVEDKQYKSEIEHRNLNINGIDRQFDEEKKLEQVDNNGHESNEREENIHIKDLSENQKKNEIQNDKNQEENEIKKLKYREREDEEIKEKKSNHRNRNNDKIKKEKTEVKKQDRYFQKKHFNDKKASKSKEERNKNNDDKEIEGSGNIDLGDENIMINEKRKAKSKKDSRSDIKHHKKNKKSQKKSKSTEDLIVKKIENLEQRLSRKKEKDLTPSEKRKLMLLKQLHDLENLNAKNSKNPNVKKLTLSKKASNKLKAEKKNNKHMKKKGNSKKIETKKKTKATGKKNHAEVEDDASGSGVDYSGDEIPGSGMNLDEIPTKTEIKKKAITKDHRKHKSFNNEKKDKIPHRTTHKFHKAKRHKKKHKSSKKDEISKKPSPRKEEDEARYGHKEDIFKEFEAFRKLFMLNKSDKNEKNYQPEKVNENVVEEHSEEGSGELKDHIKKHKHGQKIHQELSKVKSAKKEVVSTTTSRVLTTHSTKPITTSTLPKTTSTSSTTTTTTTATATPSTTAIATASVPKSAQVVDTSNFTVAAKKTISTPKPEYPTHRHTKPLPPDTIYTATTSKPKLQATTAPKPTEAVKPKIKTTRKQRKTVPTVAVDGELTLMPKKNKSRAIKKTHPQDSKENIKSLGGRKHIEFKEETIKDLSKPPVTPVLPPGKLSKKIPTLNIEVEEPDKPEPIKLPANKEHEHQKNNLLLVPKIHEKDKKPAAKSEHPKTNKPHPKQAKPTKPVKITTPKRTTPLHTTKAATWSHPTPHQKTSKTTHKPVNHPSKKRKVTHSKQKARTKQPKKQTTHKPKPTPKPKTQSSHKQQRKTTHRQKYFQNFYLNHPPTKKPKERTTIATAFHFPTTVYSSSFPPTSWLPQKQQTTMSMVPTKVPVILTTGGWQPLQVQTNRMPNLDFPQANNVQNLVTQPKPYTPYHLPTRKPTTKSFNRFMAGRNHPTRLSINILSLPNKGMKISPYGANIWQYHETSKERPDESMPENIGEQKFDQFGNLKSNVKHIPNLPLKHPDLYQPTQKHLNHPVSKLFLQKHQPTTKRINNFPASHRKKPTPKPQRKQYYSQQQKLSRKNEQANNVNKLSKSNNHGANKDTQNKNNSKLKQFLKTLEGGKDMGIEHKLTTSTPHTPKKESPFEIINRLLGAGVVASPNKTKPVNPDWSREPVDHRIVKKPGNLDDFFKGAANGKGINGKSSEKDKHGEKQEKNEMNKAKGMSMCLSLRWDCLACLVF